MEILDVVKNLEFTEYEAKVYLTLLSESSSTGYAVAKNSCVSRSKIYEVLESLTARNIILNSLNTEKEGKMSCEIFCENSKCGRCRANSFCSL